MVRISQVLAPFVSCPLGRFTLVLASIARTSSRPIPYLFSAVGFSFHADGRQRTAPHEHLADALDLGELLLEDGGCRVVHLRLD